MAEDVARLIITSAFSLIAEERAKQEAKFSPEHDDGLTADQLAKAAACYAVDGELWVRPQEGAELERVWPFDGWKPGQSAFEGKTKLECLISAGALIVAEIERIQRKVKAGWGK